MTPDQKALAALLGSFLDLLRGYPVRELHEPWKLTAERALALLPQENRSEFEFPAETDVTR